MIYTLNTRANIQLMVMKETLGLNSQDIFRQINEDWKKAIKILDKKGVCYEKLRSVLTPPHKSNRMEYVFCFDSGRIKNSWYGNTVMKKILSNINKKRNHAILHGDFCIPIESNNVAFYLLKENLVVVNQLTTTYCGQYFLIYINNLIQTEAEALIQNLSSFEGFVGYGDMTYANNLKDIVAYYLGQCCLQVGKNIIVSHEDDRCNEENINLVGYPYGEFGFTYLSVQEYYYSNFLEYKIESRRVDKSDILFSLNTISNMPVDFMDYEIIIESQKFEYIKQKNISVIQAAEIDKMELEDVKDYLKEQIKYCYLYNLEINMYEIAKFNTIIEKSINDNRKIRMLVSFEYNPEKQHLRLLNLF